MHKSKKPVGFWSAVSMGIGAMVGEGDGVRPCFLLF